MNKIDWKKKLTSRKFWAAVLAVAMSILTIFRVDEAAREQITALGWGVAALIAYILGEGLVDASKTDSGEDER